MKYRHNITGEERELPEDLLAAWREANNPKLEAWVPIEEPAVEPTIPETPTT